MMWSSFVFVLFLTNTVKALKPAIDEEIINRFVNYKICGEQLNLIADSALGRQFRETSAYVTPDVMRLDKIISLGSFTRCLTIDETIFEHHIQGKYCMLQLAVPKVYFKDGLLTNSELWVNSSVAKIRANQDNHAKFCQSDNLEFIDQTVIALINLGVCIPKTCSAKEAAKTIFSNFGRGDIWRDVIKLDYDIDQFEYKVVSCRLPHDKPVDADFYLTLTLSATILILVAASTVYDLIVKDTSASYYTIFSIYTNSKQLLEIQDSRKSIECVDGIRALSMLWIILMHSNQNRQFSEYKQTFFEITIISSAKLAVDTFFLLSGIFVVYSNIANLNGAIFFRSLPRFYSNRLMRLLPILIVWMLVEASLINHISDGPLWAVKMGRFVNFCRFNWLISLLFVNNLVNYCELTKTRCLPHAWYVDVDTQLYFISPLVLYWLLKSRRTAFIALIGAIVTFLGIALYLNYIFNFSYDGSLPLNIVSNKYYNKFYYPNPLTRGAPFFIGMFCGYILHLMKGHRVNIDKKIKYFGWIIAMTIVFLSIFARNMLLPDQSNDAINCILHTFSRSIWAAAVGWIVFACHNGYGGIVNWFLSLKLWKLPSKLSYGMFITHFSILYVVLASEREARTFTVGSEFHLFISITVISGILTFLLTVTVEMPIIKLYKLLFGR